MYFSTLNIKYNIVTLISGGLAPPLADWKDRLDEMNTAMRKLEEDYQTICIQKKVYLNSRFYLWTNLYLLDYFIYY